MVDVESKFTAVSWQPSSWALLAPKRLLIPWLLKQSRSQLWGQNILCVSYLIEYVRIHKSVWARDIPCQATTFPPRDCGVSVWTFSPYTSAVTQTNWFSSCQNTGTNESSVNDVVDLAMMRLPASVLSATKGHDDHQMSLWCYSNTSADVPKEF